MATVRNPGMGEPGVGAGKKLFPRLWCQKSSGGGRSLNHDKFVAFHVLAKRLDVIKSQSAA